MTSITLNNSLVSPLYTYPFTDTTSISLGDSTKFAGLTTNIGSLRNVKRISLSGLCATNDVKAPCGAQKTWKNNFTGVIPNGVNLISAIVVGGGGGTSLDGSGGGGGGGLVWGYIKVKPGEIWKGWQGGGGGPYVHNGTHCGTGGGQSGLAKLISGTVSNGTWVTVMYSNGGGRGNSNPCNSHRGGGGGGGSDYHTDYVITTDVITYPYGKENGASGGSGDNNGNTGPLCKLNNARYGGGGGGGNCCQQWTSTVGGAGGGGAGGSQNGLPGSGGGEIGGGSGGEGWRGQVYHNRSGGSGSVTITLNP